jgi:pSer/pThr/pTyr-binding forkhead associated (FHA) protein
VFGRGGAYFAEDMNSTNGTLLNSAELHGEAEMRDGDLLRIGDTEFKLEADS